MIPNGVDIAFEVAAISLTLSVILSCLTLIRSSKEPMITALFMFAMVSFMLSVAYWLAYNLIRPDGRMPFAANEIGEIAFFLLLAAVLDAVFRDSHVSAKKETALALIFVASSVVLWIGWSGEWIQDIIAGLAFGYFLCVCVRAIKLTSALNKREWILLGISCGIIIIAQAGTFFVPEGVKQPLDYFCYALMFTILLWLLIKSILMINKRVDERATLAMTFGVCAFSFSTLYMSSGWFYFAALFFCLVTLPLMYVSLRREVMA